jgi:hypothetical protein
MGGYALRSLQSPCQAATFQTMVNAIFSDQMDNFLLVYLDDLLMLSETQEEHLEHLFVVLQQLQDNKLHCCLLKYKFFKYKLQYVGLLIKGNTVSVSPS